MTATLITSWEDVGAGGSSSSSAIDLSATARAFVFIQQTTNISATPNQPTIAGHGRTWDLLTTTAYDASGGSRCRLTCFTSMGGAANDTIDVDAAGQAHTSLSGAVVEEDTLTTVVQSAVNAAASASLTVTLAALADAGNRAVAACATAGTALAAPDPTGSISELLALDTLAHMTVGVTTDTDATLSWINGSSNGTGGIAIEMGPPATATAAGPSFLPVGGGFLPQGGLLR